MGRELEFAMNASHLNIATKIMQEYVSEMCV